MMTYAQLISFDVLAPADKISIFEDDWIGLQLNDRNPLCPVSSTQAEQLQCQSADAEVLTSWHVYMKCFFFILMDILI